MPYAQMEKYLSAQVKYWQQMKEQISAKEVEKKQNPTFVTISREYGCCGYQLAETLVKLINEKYNPEPVWAAYDRKLLDKIMKDMGLSQSLTETLTNNARKTLTNLLQTTFSNFPPQVAVFRKLVETIRILALNGNVVIVGRAGNVITRDYESGYHVRLVASMDWRIKNVQETSGMSRKDAEKTILEKSKEREGFIKEYVKFDLSNPHNFHIVINNSPHTLEEAARLIIEGMKIKGLI